MNVITQNDRPQTPPPFFPVAPRTWAAYSQQGALMEEVWFLKKKQKGHRPAAVDAFYPNAACLRLLEVTAVGSREAWRDGRDVVVLRKRQ